MAAVDISDEDGLYPYPGQGKSKAWKYFFFRKKEGVEGPPTKVNLDMSKAICGLCKKEYAFKGNTTNFNFHLEHVHGELKAGGFVEQPKITAHFRTPGTGVQQNLTAAKQKEIDDALLQLMVGKVLPLSLVENVYFKKFVELLNPMYEIPGRKLLSVNLSRKKECITESIKKELKDIKDIAITHDGWTSVNTESYSTTTCHYINKDWKLRSVVLETKKVEGTHTGENIKSSLLQTQQRWGLPNPIAVTDNAANEQKAFELLNWTRFGCYGHRINLVVKHSLNIQELSKVLAKGRKLVTFFHQSTSVNDLLMEKQKLLQPDTKGYKLIMDVCTRWNSTHAMLKRLLELTPAIMAVVTDPGLSPKAATVLKNNVFSFDETSAVQRVVEVLEPFLKATTSVCGEKHPTMHKVVPIVRKLLIRADENESDPKCIKNIKKKMREELDKRTSDKSLALMACALNPFTKSLEFLTPEDKTVTHGNLMTIALQYSLQKKVKHENPDNPGPSTSHCSQASGSNPPLPDLPSVPTVLGIQNQEVEPMVEDTVPPVVTITETVSEAKDCKKRKYGSSDMEEWLDDVVCVGESESISNSDIITAEVARYLSALISPQDQSLGILEWWKKNEDFYPHLAILAKKYLAVPASSVPSERVFSLAGHIVNKKRSRLNSNMVDTLIFLNKNLEDFW